MGWKPHRVNTGVKQKGRNEIMDGVRKQSNLPTIISDNGDSSKNNTKCSQLDAR